MSKRAAKTKAKADSAEVPPRQISRSLKARYDAAQTNNENVKHWAMADGLSADAAANPGVRRILRNRARYEVANNCYGQGIIDQMAIDCIGTGPRLQMNADISDEDAKVVENLFADWSQAMGLADKLICARSTRSIDGEAFGMMITNPLVAHEIKLDLRLLEAEMVASSSMGQMLSTNEVDGIQFDDNGNPTSYNVLKTHPGATGIANFGEANTVKAEQMLHYFIAKRPGQRRGITSLLPALPLFAQMRRWTLAVLAAAETAADLAAVLKTNMPADGEAAKGTPFEEIPIERRMMVTMPDGWEMQQFKAEQPVSTYEAFKLSLLDEIARAELCPANLARGNSSQFNFSSAKLDGTPYGRVVKVERARIVYQMLDRIFFAWRQEAVRVEGLLPQSMRMVNSNWSHNWMWPGVDTGNPKDEAPAATERMANGTSTMAKECARDGDDWIETLDQQEREMKERKKRGLPMPSAIVPSANSAPASSDQAAKDAAAAAAEGN